MTISEIVADAVRWQAVHAPWITAGRLFTVLYAIIVLGVALSLPAANIDLHYAALRCLGVGTRLEDGLLRPVVPVALEDRMRLAGERSRLVHHYLKRTVTQGASILPADVLDWPALDATDVVPFELGTEPNWLIMNEGAHVEIWIGDALKTPDALVLAVVGTGTTGWTALLAGSEIKPDSLGSPKLKPDLRVKTLARPCDPPPPRATTTIIK